MALLQQFEVYENAPAIQRGVDSVHANERRETFNGRVFKNHLREGLLLRSHRGEGNVLGRFRDALNHARVLHGKKSFRHDDVEQNREHEH